MGKANRLSMLEVSITRHNCLDLLFCQVQYNLPQMKEFVPNLLELVLEIEVHIRCYLIIP